MKACPRRYLCLWRHSMIFFFFQAEDGIRDGTVTGVQTCALPILLLDEPSNHLDLEAGLWLEAFLKSYRHSLIVVSHERDLRSEERRVGKSVNLGARRTIKKKTSANHSAEVTHEQDGTMMDVTRTT